MATQLTREILLAALGGMSGIRSDTQEALAERIATIARHAGDARLSAVALAMKELIEADAFDMAFASLDVVIERILEAREHPGVPGEACWKILCFHAQKGDE